MSQDYILRQATSFLRTSTIPPVIIRAHEELDNRHRLSSCINSQRQLSTISQIYLPRGSEYYPQEHVPPTGPEAQQPFLLTTFEDDETTGEQNRFSVITSLYQTTDDETDEQYKGKKLNKKTRRILYIIEPIISGLILFPIIALFWQCGWNLAVLVLTHLSKPKPHFHVNETTEEDSEPYKWQALVFPYLIAQFILLLYYLGQDRIYDFLKNQKWIIKTLLLKLHIFILVTTYIIQWKPLWTIWDQFISHEWYFELALSLTSLFALIVFNGHLSDLVCSPFLFSYDSIEYCIHFGCPLLTREMKQWKINLINYILYEIIISNLSIMSWRGIYLFLDDYLYPNDLDMSAGICLIIGYLLYFPLMYFQTYLEELNLKYEFWTFVAINFPQFYRNIRHLLAFFSCVFVWRGYWVLYDNHIHIFEDYYKTYLLIYILAFFVLSILQTSSSINGPLSHINDRNNFFPLYPHCYVSIVQRKFSQLCFSKPNIEQQNGVF